MDCDRSSNLREEAGVSTCKGYSWCNECCVCEEQLCYACAHKKCSDCGEYVCNDCIRYGVGGMGFDFSPAERCPKCEGKYVQAMEEKYGDDWDADDPRKYRDNPGTGRL